MALRIIQPQSSFKHPPSSTWQVRTVGHAISEQDWDKFSQKHLLPKEQESCIRKKCGTIIFLGEYGMEALKPFYEHFKDKCTLMLVSRNKKMSLEGRRVLFKQGIPINKIQVKRIG